MSSGSGTALLAPSVPVRDGPSINPTAVTTAVTADSLLESLSLAATGGVKHSCEHGLDYLTGNFWTSRQRQGHSIHELSYRACFKPQLPELLIDLLTAKNDVVLDPFLGRGTTAVQAALMNRTAYGSDVNPLSIMLTEPRLNTPSMTDLRKRLSHLPCEVDISESDYELTTFYHPEVLKKLIALKNWFIKRARLGTLDKVDKWIRVVAITRLAGHSPGFFSVRTMPPNQAVSIETQRALNRKSGLRPENKDIAGLILKKSRSLLRSGGVRENKRNRLACASADNLNYVPNHSVGAIITSPPFLDLVDYHKDNWLRCWFAGINQDEIKIARHRKIEVWQEFVKRCFCEFSRKLRKGGYVAFEVGEARKGQILLERLVAEATAGLPYSLIAVIVNDQAFTKTANCWGISNNAKGTNSNRIVLLRRQ